MQNKNTVTAMVAIHTLFVLQFIFLQWNAFFHMRNNMQALQKNHPCKRFDLQNTY